MHLNIYTFKILFAIKVFNSAQSVALMSLDVTQHGVMRGVRSFLPRLDRNLEAPVEGPLLELKSQEI